MLFPDIADILPLDVIYIRWHSSLLLSVKNSDHKPGVCQKKEVSGDPSAGTMLFEDAGTPAIVEGNNYNTIFSLHTD
jgi:hypothetical protein